MTTPGLAKFGRPGGLFFEPPGGPVMGSQGIPSDPPNTWRLRAGAGYRHFRESANRQSGFVNTTASQRILEASPLSESGTGRRGDHEHLRARLSRHALASLPRADGSEAARPRRGRRAPVCGRREAGARKQNGGSRLRWILNQLWFISSGWQTRGHPFTIQEASRPAHPAYRKTEL